ncbi:sulfotransferase domain-containing protein [Shewanella sp. WXL01]|uniref:sulfotransferase domain-containing protein n=1 Tax=Shewanella sp. WXL01 TaxID=2709721 RepID=UPI0014385A15|nr:sulfotransferase domain-containing protein [Shewanella sp. WXL01]
MAVFSRQEHTLTMNIHCSYHKCLTSYTQKIFNQLLNTEESVKFKHFKSNVDEFFNENRVYEITSINNHALDLNSLPHKTRITRFIRDPRDLIVSGYFYHKRGAEPWTKIVNPQEKDFKGVNGVVPENLGRGKSFSSYLESLSLEDGLLAQLEFRANHLTSMRNWPTDDPRIKLYKYENILNNEQATIASMLKHFAYPDKVVEAAKDLALTYSAAKQIGKIKHIRNPQPGQWKDVFTPKVAKEFDKLYGDIIEMYNY